MQTKRARIYRASAKLLTNLMARVLPHLVKRSITDIKMVISTPAAKR